MTDFYILKALSHYTGKYKPTEFRKIWDYSAGNLKIMRWWIYRYKMDPSQNRVCTVFRPSKPSEYGVTTDQTGNRHLRITELIPSEPCNNGANTECVRSKASYYHILPGVYGVTTEITPYEQCDDGVCTGHVAG